MSKGKVLGKGQIIAVLMVAALAGAIFLNVKFSSTQKYLGEATYVNSNKSKAVATSSKTTKPTDYFVESKQSRQKVYDDAENKVKELLDTDKLTDEEKKTVTDTVKMIASNMEKCNNIETMLSSKGFKKSVAILTATDANIVVKSEGLTTAQTMQIQDIVTTQTGINLANIKIVAVK